MRDSLKSVNFCTLTPSSLVKVVCSKSNSNLIEGFGFREWNSGFLHNKFLN